MRIIARSTLKLFCKKYPDTEQPLKAWYEIIKSASWSKPNDIKKIFRSADIVPHDRVVLNIKVNKYRLVVKIKYDFQVVYIRFIGKHSEYDKIDVTKV